MRVYGDGTYAITYIDDEDQDDTNGNNDEHTIIVDANGDFDGGTIYGLLIENLNVPTPTPSPSPSPNPSPSPSPSPSPTPGGGVILY